jgi:branched-chain amino acid transport system substrate-binding protein
MARMAGTMREFSRDAGCSGLFALVLAAGMAVPGPALADITLGLAGPLSGGSAQAGAEMKLGMEAAIADVNAQGGVLHQKLALAAEDDACDAKQAVAAAKRQVERGIHFVFGPYCSAATLPASFVYADSGTLEITLSSDPGITEQGYDGLFRLTGRDDQQGKLLADVVAVRLAGKRVALLADRSFYGTGLAAAFRTEAAAQGRVPLILDQAIDAGAKDFTKLVGRLKAAGAEAVVYAGAPADLGLLVKQAAEAGVRPQFLSGNELGNHEFWDVAGSSADGTLFTFTAEAASLPSAHEAAERLQARGVNPQGYTLYAYAAVQLYAGAIDRAQSLDPEAVAAELRKGGFATVLGEISFNAAGDNATPNWRLYRWSNGRFQEAD